MQCIEQLNCPIGLNNDRPQRPQHDNLYRPEGAVVFLSSFASRQLTYDADGLNAMAGILQTWTAANPGAAHLMGVPVILPPPEERTAETLFRAVWEGLAWRTTESWVVRSTRRRGMPTWSHVGVKGARFLTDIRADTGHLPRRKETAVLKLEGGMSLEMKGGAVHTLEDFVQAGMHKTDGCRSIAALHLTGWCFTPRCFVKKNEKDYLQVPAGSSEHLLRFVPDIAAIEFDKAP
ncbi:hypothetical protein B0T11DRAFT_291379 [Plectosphaerella cucumerina]|uniref:Uncharacterized protein n=1 Tax=Plectosphaerella cucumerina TaxID=40658 RepID=A0A8K0WYB8_9PEZI|nr:hypothetical protein B0T11DRAFT_291379 [Plectosphaerella cucumerina]